MYNHVCKKSGRKAPLVADDVYEIIMKVDTIALRICVDQSSTNV